MADRNGLDFFEAIRTDDSDLPFILYTRKGSKAVVSDAVSAGVTDHPQAEHGTDQYAILANRIANVEARRYPWLFTEQTPSRDADQQLPGDGLLVSKCTRLVNGTARTYWLARGQLAETISASGRSQLVRAVKIEEEF